jgi:short-subunit dehydrogenase
MKTAVIVGAGKGMGNSIAEKFAENDFRIVLIARNEESLKEYVDEFDKKGYESYGKVADASDDESIQKAFDEIISSFESVDVLIYNAALMQGGNASQLTSDVMIEHFKTDVVGAQSCVRKVLPPMIKQKDGCILFTGGLFGVYPNTNYEFACISMNKAALRHHARMLNEELSDKGIFVGIVNIMGNVNQNDEFSPENIAEAYWSLYENKKEFEINYGEI